MSPTGLVTHTDCLEHDTGPGHPERPDRLRAVLERLRASGLADELDTLDASPADEADLQRVHGPHQAGRIDAACASGASSLDGSDTAVCPRSPHAARLAAGGGVEAALRVARGTWSNAFVAVRPPGHHAEREQAMGFCLFNNVAVAARALQEHAGLGRIAILDWDVHHGNGTQHLFERDPSIYFASLHQWPLYPGTGAAGERGKGEGEGTTRNVTMAPGSGDAAWSSALETQVLPELEAFRPDMLLVSAGFDAHALDPLAGCEVTTEGFAALTRMALQLARERCGGRLVSFLEGGYHLDALADSVEAHVGELLGDRP